MPPKPKVIEEAEAVPKDDPKAVPKEVPKDVPKANVELPAFREEPDESNNREAPSIEDEEERAIRGPQIPDRLKEALQMEAEEGPESALEPVEPGSEPEPEPKEKRGRKVLCNPKNMVKGCAIKLYLTQPFTVLPGLFGQQSRVKKFS